MKTWSKKIPVFIGIWGWVLAIAFAASAAPLGEDDALQAIQQAPDPSAAVAAYADGAALDRNDPKLDEAYVTRMVDLGLPELAYHQAQSLTTLEPNNGVAWGVVAYVDARRGQMPEAVDAINRAGQLAPNQEFVLRTAGEILAWYDFRADHSTILPDAQDSLAQTRARVGRTIAFTSAYNTASNAYRAQASANQPLAQAAPTYPQTQYQPYQTPPGAYATSTPSPVYYNPDYYYDWGPGWVEPAPWYWWQPVGIFGGFTFFPFATTFVFDNHNSFRHHHHFVHDGHGPFFHQGPNGQFFHHGHDGFVAVNRGPRGTTSFFGTPAQPNAFVARSTHAGFPRGVTTVTPPRSSVQQFTTSGQRPVTPGMNPRIPATMSGMTANRSVVTVNRGFAVHQSPTATTRGAGVVAPHTMAQSVPHSSFAMPGHQGSAFAGRPGGGGFHSAGAMGGGFHGGGAGGGHGGGSGHH